MYQSQQCMKHSDMSRPREFAQTYRKAPEVMLEDNAEGDEVLEAFLKKIQTASANASSNHDDEPAIDELSCDTESGDSSVSAKLPQLADNHSQNSKGELLLTTRIAAARGMQLDHVTMSIPRTEVTNVGLFEETCSPDILAFPMQADVRYSVARRTRLEFASGVQNLPDVRHYEPEPFKCCELPTSLSVHFEQANAIKCICGSEVDPNELDNHLGKCRIFRDTWEAAIRHFVSKRGASHVRRMITKVSAHRLSDDTMSLCALVESKGEVDECVRKLGDYAYRIEMRRVTEMFEFANFLQPKTTPSALTHFPVHEIKNAAKKL